MKFALQMFSVLALGAGLVTTTGCELSNCDEETDGAGGNGGASSSTAANDDSEGTCTQFKSLKRFNEEKAREESIAYTAGGNITIDSDNGDITLVKGSSDTLRVEYKRFVYRAYDTEDSVIVKQLKDVTVGVSESGGNLKVSSQNDDGNDGAALTVYVPTTFDGKLVINGRAGFGGADVSVDYLGAATAIDIDAAGDCAIKAAGGSVTSSTVSCKGTEVYDVSDNVTITADGLDDTKVRIKSVSDSAKGGKITGSSGLSDILLTMPKTGNFAVQAVADTGSEVTFSGLPSGCVEEAAAENSKTLTCGAAGGALYQVESGQGVAVTFK